MHPDEFLACLRADGAAISQAAEPLLDVPVPSCPKWDVRQLVNHLGRVHRWVTSMVRTRAAEPHDFPPRPPVVDLVWFDEGLTELVAALEEAGPDVAMWTFPGGGGASRFWFRRQALETAVHRWDVQLSAGRAEPMDVELALAGVDEMLDAFLQPRQGRLEGSVRFHATDSNHGEWIVRDTPDGSGLLIGHGHERADVALRATASDLLLWLWGRPVPDDRLEVFGDGAILERWRTNLSIG
jgi:uncharacterized protein (TIGR03083 family)